VIKHATETTRSKAKPASAVNDAALRLAAVRLLSTPQGRRALIKAADALLKGSHAVKQDAPPPISGYRAPYLKPSGRYL